MMTRQNRGRRDLDFAPPKSAVEFARALAQLAGMKRLHVGLALLLCLSCAWGCRKSAAPAADSYALNEGPSRAQPRLPTLSLWLDDQHVTAEIARQPLEIMTGMMFRTNLPPNEGMLFVFNDADRRGFWMKNTAVPLSLAYIDPEGVVRELHDLQPHDTNSVTSESRRIMFVLEVNRGWFQAHGVKPGAVVRSEKGPLKATFFPFR